MCGIAGIIGNLAPAEASRALDAMVSSLVHRGPDDRGSICCTVGPSTVALGHTRLAIIDLSADARQPMTESQNRYSTVFNGEIFNFRELRKILDPAGRLFRTAGDTEVILHAYARWAGESFKRFRGMFALALLDRERRQVHLVRDPLGIKPLYYYAAEGVLLFGSEVQCLLASGRIPRKLDNQSVSHFLQYGCAGSRDTLVTGVKLLQPGETLTVSLGEPEMQWNLRTYESIQEDESPVSHTDRNESTAHILHLLEDSVKCHLASDVPLGLFLSGGIDSAVILHLMRQASAARVKTFTVTFPQAEFNERHHARRLAERYDTDHHELELSEATLLAELPLALAAMDQPTSDGINTFVLARSVRESGVKVALSGLGGDELFAGYPSFRRISWARGAAWIPRGLRNIIADGGKRLIGGPVADKAWSLLSSDCAPNSVYRISRGLFGSASLSALMCNAAPDPGVPLCGPALDPVNRVSRLELEGYMTNLLLRDTDCMGMASGLEVRVPFIDKVVVRHVLSLPGKWKTMGSATKPLLRAAMRGSVPESVWKRRKMGFVLPFDRWLRSVSLGSQVEEVLRDGRVAAQVGLRGAAVSSVWTSFLQGEMRWSKPWSLYVLLGWCERHGVSA